VDKDAIMQLIEKGVGKHGSAAELSRFLTSKGVSVSDSMLSQMRGGTYSTAKGEAWVNVARALGYYDSGWQMVDTVAYKYVCQVLRDAKAKSLFLMLADKAGKGKTANTKRAMSKLDDLTNTYYVDCTNNSSKKRLLLAFCEVLGIKLKKSKGYNAFELMDLVIAFFEGKRNEKPLLVIDEVHELTPEALRIFKALYNRLEGILGVVILGSDNLPKELQRGIAQARKGYDEVESRFGRKYLGVRGVNQKEAKAICVANGIANNVLFGAIWGELDKVERIYVDDDGVERKVVLVEDLRRLKRVVERELL
jgi:hypothetical protein